MTVLPLIIHPEAWLDIDAVRAWYSELSPELPAEFNRCLIAALDQVHRNPRIYAETEYGFRIANLRRFPYQVFYRISAHCVFVLGIYHGHADPVAKVTRTLNREDQE